MEKKDQYHLVTLMHQKDGNIIYSQGVAEGEIGEVYLRMRGQFENAIIINTVEIAKESHDKLKEEFKKEKMEKK